MNILIDIGHTAHVHLFRHTSVKLKKLEKNMAKPNQPVNLKPQNTSEISSELMSISVRN